MYKNHLIGNIDPNYWPAETDLQTGTYMLRLKPAVSSRTAYSGQTNDATENKNVGITLARWE